MAKETKTVYVRTATSINHVYRDCPALLRSVRAGWDAFEVSDPGTLPICIPCLLRAVEGRERGVDGDDS